MLFIIRSMMVVLVYKVLGKEWLVLQIKNEDSLSSTRFLWGCGGSVFDTTTVMEYGGCRATQEGLVLSGAGAKALCHATAMPV